MEKIFETILTLALPYEHRLTLQRTIYRGGPGPRVAVTAGLHGDELEGLYLCHRLAAWLEQMQSDHPGALLGQVELYPALNPLGLETLYRTVPVYGVDLNLSFPGHAQGLLPSRIAAAAMAKLEGAALVIDVHASDVALRELTQVRLQAPFRDVLLPLARRLNPNFVWVQQTAPKAGLSYHLNRQGTPCLVIETGIGLRLTPAFTDRLFTGILNLWQHLGVVSRDLPLAGIDHNPPIVYDDEIHDLNAATAGLFLPAAAHGSRVEAQSVLGRIVSPFEGGTLEEIRAPADGVLVSLREYPLVYEGSLVARVVDRHAMEEGR